MHGMDRSGVRPKARTQDLLLEEIPDELLIYDLKRARAHCLNPVAALLWRRCDGKRSVATLTKQLQAEVDEPISEDWVWLGLERLGRAHLLTERPPAAARGDRLPRRSALLRLAALPAVVSILAPTAAQAASPACLPLGACCGGGGDCCAGLVCNTECSGGPQCVPEVPGPCRPTPCGLGP